MAKTSFTHKAQEDGFEAFIDWCLEHDGPWPLNPWPLYSPEGRAWIFGWNDAAQEECRPELIRKRSDGLPVFVNATAAVNADNLGVAVLFGAIDTYQKELYGLF
jgi:hypothetical protein